MNFTQAIISGFKNYTTGAGRASRSEYWYWTLFTALGGLGFDIFDKVLFHANFSDGSFASHPLTHPLSLLWTIATLLPSLGVLVRRLHDVNRKAVWLLIGFTIIGLIPLFIWSCMRGAQGNNRFGSDPLGEGDDAVDEQNKKRVKWFFIIIGIVLLCVVGAGVVVNKAMTPTDSQIAELENLAASGDVQAEGRLANLYRSGRGVKRDDLKAVMLAQQAAERGDSNAQFTFSSMLFLGRGIHKNFPDAYKWLALSRKNGYQFSDSLMDTVKEKLSPAEIVDADKWVSEWQPYTDVSVVTQTPVKQDENKSVETISKKLFLEDISRKLQTQIGKCWSPPDFSRNQYIPVDIHLRVNPDRTIGEARVIDQDRLSKDNNFRLVAESALAALKNPACIHLDLPDNQLHPSTLSRLKISDQDFCGLGKGEEDVPALFASG